MFSLIMAIMTTNDEGSRWDGRRPVSRAEETGSEEVMLYREEIYMYKCRSVDAMEKA